MVLKTFNIAEEVYSKFSEFCKAHGISMSKQVELFMNSQIGEGEVKPNYIKKLKKLEKQKGIPFRNIAELKKIIEG